MARFGKLLLTRERGRVVAREMPQATHLTLDFKDVEVASPSFLDEIIRNLVGRGITVLRFVNTSESTNQTIERLIKLQDDKKKKSRLEVQLV